MRFRGAFAIGRKRRGRDRSDRRFHQHNRARHLSSWSDPESFQLEESGPHIFVNLASKNEIAVINRQSKQITTWKLARAGTNFPVALDEKNRRLFVAACRPAMLLVREMATGPEVARLPGAADSDDMWHDATRRRIYVPGGEGLIFVYQQADANHYSLLAKIHSAIGARTSAYFGQVGKAQQPLSCSTRTLQPWP